MRIKYGLVGGAIRLYTFGGLRQRPEKNLACESYLIRDPYDSFKFL